MPARLTFRELTVGARFRIVRDERRDANYGERPFDYEKTGDQTYAIFTDGGQFAHGVWDAGDRRVVRVLRGGRS